MKQKVCVHQPEYVMSIDDVCYHGASKCGALSFKGNVMINFTQLPDIPIASKLPSELSRHLKLNFGEEIMIPWPDFEAPLVKPSFWKALHEYIKRQSWDMVCFHCEAGHGRTGTALSSMLVAIQGYTPDEAVYHVRTNYCIEAVETQNQCEYLMMLDEYYNGREPELGAIPVPSMIFKMQLEAAKQNSHLEECSDSYEGFAGVRIK